MGNIHSQYSLLEGGKSHILLLVVPLVVGVLFVIAGVLLVLQYFDVISFLSFVPLPTRSSPVHAAAPVWSSQQAWTWDDIQFFHMGKALSTDQFTFSSTGDVVVLPTYMNTTGVEDMWGNLAGRPSDTFQAFPMDTATNAVGSIPLGLTSAVPLGGVGTGNYEVRVDGKMYHSTIRNQDMAGEPWQGTVRDFLMTVTINGVPYAIQIQPRVAGLTSVPSIVYQGLFPVSKLSFLGMSLYMYSTITPSDLKTSNTPAVAFLLRYTNTVSTPVIIAFNITMPFGIRNDWKQVGGGASLLSTQSSAAGCANACSTTASCFAWEFNVASGQCTADNTYTQGFNQAGVDSGHPGSWDVTDSSIGFTHSRMRGSIGYNGIGQQVLYSPDPVDWISSWSPDSLSAVMSVSPPPVPSGDSAEMTIVHAWYFPVHYWNRDHGGYDHGNAYTNQFSSAVEAAASMDHSAIVQNLGMWQMVYSGMPPDIQDNLFNGLSHIRSAMYFQNGDWRQWEGYGFVDTDSIHNDAERRVQYFTNFPQTEQNKIIAWGTKLPQSSGMITEQFGQGGGQTQPYDTPFGRVMADVTQMFPCLVLEHVILHNDSSLLQSFYASVIVPATNWMINQAASSPWGLPGGLVETYDGPGEGLQGAALYSYTMYAMGLRCAHQAALYMDDAPMATKAQAFITSSQQSAETHLWMDPFYTAETIGTTHMYDKMAALPIRSSCGLQAQVEAYRLNLGDLLSRDRMKSHLLNTRDYLQTPFGMEFNKGGSRYQNWAMAEHSVTTLMLYWNEQGNDAWDQTLSQIRHIRDDKLDLWRPSAVYETNYGANYDLNFYQWNKWSEHHVQAFSGQTTNLYEGWLSLSPHSSAFDTNGNALVPVQWGGYLGYLTLSPTAATITTAFAETTYVFNTVTICGTVFNAVTLQLGTSWQVSLPQPCASAVGNTTMATSNQCTLVGVANYQIIGLTPDTTQRMSLTQCEASALSSQAQCMLYVPNLVTGYGVCPPNTPCCLIGFDPVVCNPQTLIPYNPSYGNVVAAKVQCPTSSCTQGSVHTNTAFDSGVFSLTIPSAIVVQPLATQSLCQAQALQYRACGWVWYSQSPVTQQQCKTGSPCCFLNMYTDCRATAAVVYSGATLGYLSCPNRDFSLGGQYNS